MSPRPPGARPLLLPPRPPRPTAHSARPAAACLTVLRALRCPGPSAPRGAIGLLKHGGYGRASRPLCFCKAVTKTVVTAAGGRGFRCRRFDPDKELERKWSRMAGRPAHQLHVPVNAQLRHQRTVPASFQSGVRAPARAGEPHARMGEFLPSQAILVRHRLF